MTEKAAAQRNPHGWWTILYVPSSASPLPAELMMPETLLELRKV
jgi:hypothetical protein